MTRFEWISRSFHVQVFRLSKEAIKKYVLIFVLSLVSISMVITLAPLPTGYTTRMESNVLAEVDGNQITVSELQQSIRQRFSQPPTGADGGHRRGGRTGALDDAISDARMETSGETWPHCL